MKNQLPSLITADAQEGLALASRLARELQGQLTISRADNPGGTTYGLPPSVPFEVTSSILFYAIAAANGGWSKTTST